MNDDVMAPGATTGSSARPSVVVSDVQTPTTGGFWTPGSDFWTPGMGVLVSVMVVLAALVRGIDLARQPLWLDESYTAICARRVLTEGVWSVSKCDSIAPGYYWLAALSERLAHVSPLWLRMPSLVAGVIGVPLMGLLAWEITRRRTIAAWAMLFMAVSPLSLWYSQEARCYQTLLMVSTIYLILTVRTMRSGMTGRRVLWFALLTASMLWLHHCAAYLVAACGILALRHLRLTRRGFWWWMAAHALGGLAFVPWVMATSTALSSSFSPSYAGGLVSRSLGAEFVLLSGPSVGPSPRQVGELGAMGALHAKAPAVVLVAVLAVLVLVAAWRSRVLSRSVWIDAVIVFLVPQVLLLLSAKGGFTLLNARYVIFTGLVTILLAAVAASRVPRSPLAVIAALLTLAVFAWGDVNAQHDQAYVKENATAFPAILAGQMRPGDTVLLANPVAAPQLVVYGLHCPAATSELADPSGLQTLASSPASTPGRTWVIEYRQWERIRSSELDPQLDRILGRPEQTWVGTDAVLQLRPKALGRLDGSGLMRGCGY